MVRDLTERPSLLPADLVALAHSTSRGGFADQHAATPFLLVRLPVNNKTLIAGLSACTSGRSSPLASTGDAMAFGTSSISFTRMSRQEARAADFGPHVVRSLLRTAQYYALALRKREGSFRSYTHKLSVGRTLNNDVPLRDPSVSKFHAWIECDEMRTFFVTDAKSKNATALNHYKLRALRPEPLQAGDVLEFGSVWTLFCPPEVLWDALKSDHLLPPRGRGTL